MTIQKIKHLTWSWGPVVLVIGATFVLSSMSVNFGRYLFFEHEDKVIHGIEFAGIGWLIFRAFMLTTSWPLRTLTQATLLFGAMYGALDEFHQVFTPGRDVDLYDFFADFLGVCLGCAVWILFKTFYPKDKNDSKLQTKSP